MEDTTRQPEKASYHYANGSVAPCEHDSCTEPRLTLEQASDELSVDATQGLYRPRHAQGVES